MKKRFLSLILAALMLAAIVPLTASAATVAVAGYEVKSTDVTGLRINNVNGKYLDIYKGGTYTLSAAEGASTDYGILVSTEEDVTLVLNGINISKGSDIGYGISTISDNTTIVLADNSVNTIVCEGVYSCINNASYGSNINADAVGKITITCENENTDHDCDKDNCGVLDLISNTYGMTLRNATTVNGGIINIYSEGNSVVKGYKDGKNNENKEILTLNGGELWLYARKMGVEIAEDIDVVVNDGELYCESLSNQINLGDVYVNGGLMQMYVYGAGALGISMEHLWFELPDELMAEIYTGKSKTDKALSATISSEDLVDHSTLASGKCYWLIETKSPLDFAVMTPSVSNAQKESRYTELGEVEYNTTCIFGYVPKALPAELISAGYTHKYRILVNHNGGTIVTRTTNGQFDLMQYVTKTGDYSVWFMLDLYKDGSYVDSYGHIYELTVVPCEIDYVSATVTTPYAGMAPDKYGAAGGEGYTVTDIDWSYYNEKDGEFYLMPDGMTFEAGKRYECAVQFETLDGYIFPENRADFGGELNGVKGYIPSVYYTTKAYVTVEFIPEVNPNINADWGKTEEDIIKSVEYVLNDDGTYNAHVSVDLSNVDPQMLQHEWEGTGYYWYDHNNNLHTGSIGGLGLDDLQFTIKNLATNLEAGKSWQVKVYLSDDYYADYEWQGYSFSVVTFTVPEAELSYTLGDVNADGAIDQFDYILVKRHYFGTRYLTETEMLPADANCDGTVDQFDYILIKRHYFGTFVIGG